jgi:hypothetical protein
LRFERCWPRRQRSTCELKNIPPKEPKFGTIFVTGRKHLVTSCTHDQWGDTSLKQCIFWPAQYKLFLWLAGGVVDGCCEGERVKLKLTTLPDASDRLQK